MNLKRVHNVHFQQKPFWKSAKGRRIASSWFPEKTVKTSSLDLQESNNAREIFAGQTFGEFDAVLKYKPILV